MKNDLPMNLKTYLSVELGEGYKEDSDRRSFVFFCSLYNSGSDCFDYRILDNDNNRKIIKIIIAIDGCCSND